MKYDKNAISNTARNLRSKSSGLANIQTRLSRVSPKKCSSSFYSRRSSLVRRLSNVQNEINSLSGDISNAASKMSSDDVQNAYHIRQVFSNRTSKLSYGQKLFSAGDTNLKRSGVFGSPLLFSQTAMNRRAVSSLGNASPGSTPWYVKVGKFGSNVWNGALKFFSNAGKWGSERLNDLREWGKSAGEYTWKSITKFVLGDYSDDNITALSFVGNIVTGIVGIDLPLDARDLAYDVQHWGEGDNFGFYFALDVAALLPVIGAVKYCKYADDVADGAKDLGKVADAASDTSKDLGKATEIAGDASNYSKSISYTDADTDHVVRGNGIKGNNISGARNLTAFTENLPSLKADYKYKNGYFGEPGQGRQFVRNIRSDDPVKTARDFYDKAAHGGIEKEMSNGKGVYTKMKDGSILSYREVSSSDGSPAVEINIKHSTDHGDIKYQKIHFVKGS